MLNQSIKLLALCRLLVLNSGIIYHTASKPPALKLFLSLYVKMRLFNQAFK